MRKFAVVLGVVAATVCSCFAGAYAEMIKLKSGQEVEATIKAQDKEKMVIDAYGVQMMYYFDQISEVDGKPIDEYVKIPFTGGNPPPPLESEPVENTGEQQAVTANATTSSVPASLPILTPNVPDSDDEEIAPPEASVVPPQINKDVETRLSEFSGDRQARSSKEIEELLKKYGPALGIIIAVIVVLSLAAYVFSSYCLQLIASKTSVVPLWWAWVPIFNVFLMCKIAGLRYWWLLIFFAGIVPFVGGLAVVGFEVYMWWRISEARSKPGWMGILMAVPLVNMFVLGHLAFSE